MASLLDKIETTAREVGVLEEQLKLRWAEMGGLPEAAVPTLEEAVDMGETKVPRERFVLLVRYWEAHGALEVKREILRAIKNEIGKERSSGDRQEDRGHGGRQLTAKTVAHLKDAKFSGRDGGAGWSNFFEDLLVSLGAVDKDLEEAVKEVTDMKKKLDEPDEVKLTVDKKTWDRYSGELYARLMEITKDDAQKLVRNEGQKSGRCGLWTLRKMMERYNPKTYMRLLKTLCKVIKPTEAKTTKDVQATIEDWESEVAKLEDEYGEKLNDNIKVAILIAMVPGELQEKSSKLRRATKRSSTRQRRTWRCLWH